MTAERLVAMAHSPRSARLTPLALVLAAAIGVAGAGAASPAPARAASGVEALRPASARGPLTDERLSDERALSRWAYPQRLGWARAAPAADARRVARLRWATESERPELYLALRARVTDDGTWVQVRLPRRPNGGTGWVRRGDLGPLNVVRTSLEIDRRRMRARLLVNGRVAWRARIGVGAVGTMTPAGRFYVREKLRNLGGDPLYGAWAIGTSAYSRLSDWPGGGVVGIHGTDRPELIPGRPSHGCVRLTNRAVTRLVRLLPLGTPVEIR